MSEEEQFYEFMLARTKPEKVKEMQELLTELVARRDANRLNKMYLMGTIPRVFSYLNPDDLEEVKQTVTAYAENMK